MLQEIRKLFGYTQEELAKKVGVTQNYYTQIESGSSRSAPLVARISSELKIKESFLLSLGEYYEYPFLAESYVFCLKDRKIIQSYRFIQTFICAPSKYADVVFFLGTPKMGSLWANVICMAIRDDHNTVFIFTTRVKAPSFSSMRQKTEEPFNYIFRFLNVFREDIHKLPSTFVYEKTVRVDESFEHAVKSESIRKEDVLPYFPTKEYLTGLCNAHGND